VNIFEQFVIGFKAKNYFKNYIFHYTHRVITPKRVTSLRCLSPQHNAKAT